MNQRGDKQKSRKIGITQRREVSHRSRKKPTAARQAEEQTEKEVANKNWMSHEKEVAC